METLSLESELQAIQEELEKAAQFQPWDPPAGTYEALCHKFHEDTGEADGAKFPTYRVYFKIVDAEELERDTFSRYFSLRRGKARGYQLLEFLKIARAVNSGKALKDFSKALAAVRKACDSGTCLVNVNVRYEPYTDRNGNERQGARYDFSATTG